MKRVFSIAAIVLLSSCPVFAIPLLSPGDFIIAIDMDGNSAYPDGEAPAYAIDGTLGKYLNFGKENTGFIVTPSMGATIIESFQITTANDSPERDPAGWFLSGTNDAIVSADNSTGLDENWTVIGAGFISLPDDRNTVGPMVALDNTSSYTSYRMQFFSVKNGVAANSMQIAEIQFFGTPEPATLCLLGLGGLSLVMRRRRS